MPQSSYPTGNDLRDFLATTGLTPSNLTDYEGAQAAGNQAFESLAGRKMLAGASETRRYDPPTNRDALLGIDDAVSITQVSYQPQGSSEQVYVLDTDYTLEPNNAAAKGVPFTRILFRRGGWITPLSPHLRRSIYVTGEFGFGATIPDNAWQAMRMFGAIGVFSAGVLNTTGGAQSYTDGSTGYSETKSPVMYASVLSDWQKQATAIASRYRKVRL